MTLSVDIKHRLGRFWLDAKFETDGGLIALLGRSGSGKTSIVNVIAGLIRPDQGHVAIDGTVLVDTAQSLFISRHRRRVATFSRKGACSRT
jgi:molybdate transport system ATP-binding protein